jgi:DNA-binding NarL/FixJ family response regulator
VRRRPGNSPPIRVYIVSSTLLAFRYLRHLLKNDRHIRIFQEDQANSNLTRGDQIVFLLDLDALRLPLSAYMRTLRARFPDAKILLLGKQLPADELSRSLFFGIDGFMTYNEVERKIQAAIRALAHGRLWFTPEVLAEYVSHLRSTQLQPKPNLTKKEAEVLGLVERGFSNKEIAAQLSISESTVKFHLSNAFAKLGVENRRAAVEQGLSAAFSQATPHER